MLSLAVLFVIAVVGAQASEGAVKARAFGHHDLGKRAEVEILEERDLSNITARGNGKKQGLDWGQDAGPLKNFAIKGAPVYNW